MVETLKINGVSNKTILCKDDKVKIIDFGGLFSQKREKLIQIDSITGVEVKKPSSILNGYIQLQIAGQISANTARGDLSSALKDENSVVFSGMDAYQIALAIQSHILAHRPGAAATSDADELIKLKKLLDDGALTEVEYQTQKAKIINK